jgi:DNA-binding CsgD family transcriptional regulator
MLYGRQSERARISRLLADASGGRGGVLVIRGDAGIGKSTLLLDAAQQAGNFHVLRGTGVDSEVELALAALHQLLRPVLDRLDRLPAPQASALRGAFGLVDGQPDRFHIELGALSLLTEVAKQRPVLCLVDDAQWLDRASADALVFVARRLRAEPILVLLAARDDDVRQFSAPGLPELVLGGLDAVAAGQLLGAGTQQREIAASVRDWLIQETDGNPLAVLELPGSLTGEQLAGRVSLPEWLPLGATLQQAFLQRMRRLPAATQALLLVAASEDAGELTMILSAGRILGLFPEALEPAEREGLVQIIEPEPDLHGLQQLRFSHPLIRSAIYETSTFTARRAAHRALTEVLVDEQHADRRAWHLAAAAIGPDEGAAVALEVSADRARRRGGPAAAAAALVRAAALTPEPGSRARRLVAAAEYLWEVGHGQRVQALLDDAEPLASDPRVRASIAHIRGAIELSAGIPAMACTLLLDGARLVTDSDPRQAGEMLVLATWGALAADQLERIVDQILPAIRRLPGHGGHQVRAVADSLTAFGLGPRQRDGANGELPADLDPRRGAAGTWPHPIFTWMWPMLVVAEPARGDVAADQRYARSVAARRAAGTVSSLTIALANLALAQASLGKWSGAIQIATEGLRITRETGQDAMAAYFLAMLAAIAAEQGRDCDCRRLVHEALAAAVPRRLAVVAAFASWTLATLDLAEGRPAAALSRLRALAIPRHPTAHTAIALLATGTLVEAAAQADALEEMDPVVSRFEQCAQEDGRTWTLAVAHRCRALVSTGEDAERHFQSALATDGLAELPFELARTELLYGEWLRRARRRADARTHLRAALDLFEPLGATPWIDRTAAELRASGETARRRDPSTLLHLTPQELRIARLARQGLTNREIAVRLFLSPHTVSYHLHKIYTKLGIASRGDLRLLDLDATPDDPA